MSNLSIQKQLAKTESVLSAVAAIPIVGTAAGITKIVLGIFEILGGLIFADEGDKTMYAKHGAYNIMAGFFEAIPILGTAIFVIRLIDKRAEMSFNSQGGLFVSYNEIYDEDRKKTGSFRIIPEGMFTYADTVIHPYRNCIF